MGTGTFDRPVGVAVDPRGNVTEHVTRTERAAEILLYEWPGDPGAKKHLAARKACIAVLEGLKEARAARLAFEAAAKEADVFRESGRRPVVLKSEGPPLWRNRKRKLKRDM